VGPCPTTESAKVRVIYILGWGHSGSTLLAMLLGTSRNVLYAGEMAFFNFYRDGRSHPKAPGGGSCTCGRQFHDCRFWQRVVADSSCKDADVLHDESHMQRVKWLLKLLWHRLIPGAGRRSRPVLGDDAALLKALLAAAGSHKRYVCDSSKDFARLARLLMMPEVDVVPVHLVRDGRAVAYSYAKREREQLGLKRHGYFASILLWIGVNVVDRLILLFSQRKPLQVSYDRFCQHPEEYIRYFNSRLGTDIPEKGFVQAINGMDFHSLGGNRVLRLQQIPEIRLDDQWERRLSRPKRVLAAAIAWLCNSLWVRRDNVSRDLGTRRDGVDRPSSTGGWV